MFLLLLLLLLSPVKTSPPLLLLWNQRESPPLRAQISGCSTFRFMCDDPSAAVFRIEYIECSPPFFLYFGRVLLFLLLAKRLLFQHLINLNWIELNWTWIFYNSVNLYRGIFLFLYCLFDCLFTSCPFTNSVELNSYIYIYIYIYIVQHYIYIAVHKRTHTHVCVCARFCVCMCLYICIYIYTQTHTHTHTQTHREEYDRFTNFPFHSYNIVCAVLFNEGFVITCCLCVSVCCLYLLFLLSLCCSVSTHKQ